MSRDWYAPNQQAVRDSGPAAEPEPEPKDKEPEPKPKGRKS